MTLEELKAVLEKLDFFIKSSSFPGSYLGISANGDWTARSLAKRFIRENGNSCKIVSADLDRKTYDCICFSVEEWLYFVKRDDGICLRRVSWDKVEFLDTDLIKIKEDGDPE